jgi:hypothetical protein
MVLGPVGRFLLTMVMKLQDGREFHNEVNNCQLLKEEYVLLRHLGGWLIG